MVQWTQDKDMVILNAILQFNNIKISKELLEFCASAIGEGCTSKAVTHRIANIKARASAITGPTSASGPSTPVSTPRKRGLKAAATPTGKVNSATPTPTPKRGRTRKRAEVVEEAEELGGNAYGGSGGNDGDGPHDDEDEPAMKKIKVKEEDVDLEEKEEKAEAEAEAQFVGDLYGYGAEGGDEDEI
ncbi:hypothetical protein P154DRAFT_559929 [Amniculicola lignicola CBS 123094]|uniref:Uncharacterized protein n=1 Tax=Amniculicola lignicola CBS 123094 TaxID=1392246 RepID=A0A6A5WUL0_9PLEO|nr:hypothetical protein P154DRAFT_559929 [Amniculicola lignicola CBS 123094]